MVSEPDRVHSGRVSSRAGGRLLALMPLRRCPPLLAMVLVGALFAAQLVDAAHVHAHAHDFADCPECQLDSGQALPPVIRISPPAIRPESPGIAHAARPFLQPCSPTARGPPTLPC